VVHISVLPAPSLAARTTDAAVGDEAFG
jgi:hypothetical protein